MNRSQLILFIIIIIVVIIIITVIVIIIITIIIIIIIQITLAKLVIIIWDSDQTEANYTTEHSCSASDHRYLSTANNIWHANSFDKSCYFLRYFTRCPNYTDVISVWICFSMQIALAT